MACCAHCRAADTQFDARRAERDLRQYKRRGVDAVTKLMLSELQRRPMPGCGLLDVGAGIGVISSEMAATGIVKATIVEASPAYLDVARRVVRSRYRDGFTQFVLGDFAVVAASLPDADAVTLGRVVCCYPDAETLLQLAAARTRRILALTYPRYRWYVRAGNMLQNLWRRFRGSAFRTFVHLPKRMEEVLKAGGLVRVAQKGTLLWMLEVYERPQPSRE